MKKRWMWVLLYGVYGILLAALLALQWTAMGEDMLRLLANILALLLACPVMLLVFAGRADSEKRISGKNAISGKDVISEKHVISEKNTDTEEKNASGEQIGTSGKQISEGGEQINTSGKQISESGEQIEDESRASQTEPKIRTMEAFCEWAERWNFSAREQEVGWLIYKGYTNRQIAQELYIAETTVKKHAGHIYEKAGVSGRKEFSALLRE